MKRTVLAVAAMALLYAMTFAQVPLPDIYGTAVLPDGSPIPGVTVTLTSDVGGAMTAVTSEEGNFRFLKLSPGNYELKFELEGFKTVIRKGIRLYLGKNATLNVQMETSTLQEEVVVTAKANVVDTRKTTVGANITKEQIQSLPTSRNPWTILSLVPGMMIDRVDIGGNESGQQSNFFAGGTGSGDTSWNVDGANITDMSALGSAPSYLNVNSYEEMQISVGANDVTAQTGGVQLNFITKRAGNKTTGDFHLYAEDKAWEMKKMLPAYMRAQNLKTPGVNRMYQYGFNVGGPVIKDKMWWYGSWAIQDVHARTEIGNEDATWLLSGYVKLNFQFGNTNGDVHMTYDNKKKWGRTVVAPALQNDGSLYDQYGPGFIYYAGLNHVMGNLMLSAKFVYTDGGFTLDPRGANINPDTGHNEGNEFHFYYATGHYLDALDHYITDRNQINASIDGNYFLEKTLNADHEIRFGVDYITSDTTTEDLYPNQRIAYLASPTAPGYTLLGVYPDYFFNVNYSRLSFYLSDTATWGKLTATLGLRFDKESGKVLPYTWQKFTWYEPGSIYHNLPKYNDVFGFGELQIQETKSVLGTSVFSPRLSLTYDISGDSKNVVKLSVAQYGSQGGNTIASPYITYRYGNAYWTDANGDRVPQWGEMGDLYWWDPLKLVDPATNLVRVQAAENYNSPLLDELTLSFEKAIGEDLALSVNGIYRKQHRQQLRYGIMPDGSIETAANWFPRTTTINGHTITVYDRYTAPVGRYYLNGSSKNYNKFLALTLAMTKKLSNKWMADASFTFDSSKSYADPDQTFNQTNFHFYNDGAAVAPASGGSGYTGIYSNARWLFKLSGLYQLPWDLNLSAVLQAREGYPYLLRRYVRGLNRGNVYVVDDNGGTYQMGDSERRLPTFWLLNFGLEKVLKVSDTVNVTLCIDAYNVLNQQIALIYQVNCTDAIVADPSQRVTKVTTPGLFQFGARVNF